MGGAIPLLTRTVGASSLLALLAVSFAVDGRYRHQSFVSLYRNADAILVGHIVEVTPDTYRVRIAEVFRGHKTAVLQPGDAIDIGRFRNWTSASRWTAYTTKQHLLLFLRLSGTSAKLPAWHALGAANEGEMPIEGNSVYVGASGDGSPIGSSHRVYGASYPSREFPLAVVLAALRTGDLPSILFAAPLRPMREVRVPQAPQTNDARPHSHK
jgi:hypothetical protein